MQIRYKKWNILILFFNFQKMSEELRAFLNFCKTEKLEHAKKNEHVTVTLYKLDTKDSKSKILLTNLTFKQYYIVEGMYRAVHTQPLDPIEYGIILSDSLT